MSIWRSVRRSLPDVDKDDMLEVLGLESRRNAAERVLPVVAIFGAGLLVGVSLGLMVAQKPGRELRDELRHRLRRGEGNNHDDDAVEEVSGNA